VPSANDSWNDEVQRLQLKVSVATRDDVLKFRGCSGDLLGGSVRAAGMCFSAYCLLYSEGGVDILGLPTPIWALVPLLKLRLSCKPDRVGLPLYRPG